MQHLPAPRPHIPCVAPAFVCAKDLISGLGGSFPSLPRGRLGILSLLPDAGRTRLDDVLDSVAIHLDARVLDVQPGASRLLDSVDGLLAGIPDLGCGRLGARGEVRSDEESRKEPCERGQVDDVEDDGQGLSGGVETGDVLVFLGQMGLAGGGVSRGGGGRVRVRDEEGEGGRGAADEELGDLHRGQGLLDGFRNSNGERGDDVIGVLLTESVRYVS